MLKVSVVLPIYNGCAYLSQCLESINNQSIDNFELIVIDDGSIDNSFDIVSGFVFREGVLLRLISRPNKGLTRTLIEGVSISKSNLIARVDQDDIWGADHLKSAINTINLRQLNLYGSPAYLVNNNMETLSKSCSNLKTKDLIKYFLYDNPFIHSGVVFKRKCYDRVGGYVSRDIVGEYVQDYDLWVRMLKYGKAEIGNFANVKYRVSSHSMTKGVSPCFGYRARASVMLKSYRIHKKYHIFFLINFMQILLKLFLFCVFKRMDKKNDC
jgi:glycosyltransferase involved in cell wall biosynthesis